MYSYGIGQTLIKTRIMKVKGLRWFIIGLIFLATVINYIDRSGLGIMWGSEDLEGSISYS